MATSKCDRFRAERRAKRVRYRVKQAVSRLRLTVFRSLQHIYAQIIDDAQHMTVVSCSSQSMKVSGDKTEQARLVGLELAKLTKEKGIEAVVFDRGSYLYHGRVRALADGVREGGIQI